MEGCAKIKISRFRVRRGPVHVFRRCFGGLPGPKSTSWGVRGALWEVLGESGGVFWGDVPRRGATWCDEACPDDVRRRLESAGSPGLSAEHRGPRGLLFLPGRRGIKLECSPPLWIPWVHVGGVMNVMGVYCETAFIPRVACSTCWR